MSIRYHLRHYTSGTSPKRREGEGNLNRTHPPTRMSRPQSRSLPRTSTVNSVEVLVSVTIPKEPRFQFTDTG